MHDILQALPERVATFAMRECDRFFRGHSAVRSRIGARQEGTPTPRDPGLQSRKRTNQNYNLKP